MIGTTNPNDMLHVNGSGPYVGMRIANTGTAGRAYIITSTDSTNPVGGGKFGIFDNNASLYRAVIDSNGNVGIGSTSPGAKLDVSGNM